MIMMARHLLSFEADELFTMKSASVYLCGFGETAESKVN
jgi:hypothetical protein